MQLHDFQKILFNITFFFFFYIFRGNGLLHWLKYFWLNEKAKLQPFYTQIFNKKGLQAYQFNKYI